MIAVNGMVALSGRGSSSQNASPRTSWPGHSIAGFVLTKSERSSQAGARYKWDRQFSRQMQIRNIGGETR